MSNPHVNERWFVGESELDPHEYGFDGTIWAAPFRDDGGPVNDLAPWPIAEHIQDERTARLIAAAPDLLRACLAAKAFGSQGDTHEGLSVSNIIDRAIAKATDRSGPNGQSDEATGISTSG